MQLLVWAIIIFAIYLILTRRKQAVIFKRNYLIVRSSKLSNMTFSKDDIYDVQVLRGALPKNAVVLNSSLYFGPITRLWTGTPADRIIFSTRSGQYVVHVDNRDTFMQTYQKWKDAK